ncbi:hypothetical protein UFOVP1355_37 [uncultured Caudovirales phage]|uniref:Uncharacterized protein n=1 Tax=uncultured Caudovirales phage TaxID=2100421 RepID=A0A6J5S0G8_9CAUD|nr:hypothetical protein UFOVP1355_37 [uncultured Caudovirales phage]
MDYLVFTTEAVAKTALDVIYANMVDAVQSPDLMDVSTGQVVDKASLTPEEAVQTDANFRSFPIFGVNASTQAKNLSEGYTTAWATAQQTLQNSWVFVKPDDSLLVGVTGYTVKPYSPDWFPVWVPAK